MRLRRLSLLRYGKFNDRLLEFPPAAQDLHLIVGANEAGKSTTRGAIGDLLFGIPLRTPLGFLHPMSELRLGALLEKPGAEPLDVQRAKGSKQTLRSAADDAPLPEDALRPWLGDTTRALFERMHGLDHAALIAGGDGILSAADDLGRLLFQSAAGLEGLGPLQAAFAAEESALWAPHKSKNRAFYQARDAFEQAASALKAASARSKDWKEQAEAVRAAERALAEVQTRQREVRRRRGQLERIRRVLPLLAALDGAQARLDALGDAALLPEDAATVLAETATDSALARAEQQRHREALDAAQAALAALRPEPALLALAEEIRSLGDEALQCRGHAAEIERLRREAAGLWQQAQAAARQLGWPDEEEEAALRARLPAAALAAELDELLQRREGLQQQADAARRSREAKQAEREQAQAAFDALPPAQGRPALLAALERARRLGDHAAVLDEARTRQRRLEALAQAARQRLGRWPLDAASLPPDAALVQRLLDEERRDAAALAAAEAQARGRADELARAERELAQLIQAWQPVSREQVIEARQHREALYRELPQRAADYEQAVAAADALADRRLERIQHEAERQARAQAIELLALTLAQEGERAELLRRRLGAAAAAWQDLTLQAGLAGLPLALAPDWLAARRQALDADEAAADAAGEAATLARLGDEAWQGLQRELDLPSAGLDVAIRQAEAELAGASRAQGERATLAAQIADAGKALLALQADEAQAQQRWEVWQRAWSAASAALGFAPQRADLAALAGLGQTLARLGELRGGQIERLQAALAQLTARTEALLARAAPEPAGRDAGEAIAALQARSAAARQADAEMRRAEAAAAAARAGQAEAGARLDAVAARLSLLVALAGSEDREALARAVEASRQRRAATAAWETCRTQLAQGGDGLALDALRAEAAAVDGAELGAQWEEIQQQEDRLLHEAQALGAAHEKARAQLDAFDGSDRAARAEAQRQDAVAQMAQAAQDYARTRAASRLLQWTIERHRQTRQGPLLAQAGALFAMLTQGSFSRLLVDFSTDEARPRLQGLRPDGRALGVEAMSEGTRDQLYLALRLAALMASGAAPLPFIADDLFVNFDDGRAAAGLQALAELSKTTQVLFLTHHRHLVDVAREALGSGLNVVEL